MRASAAGAAAGAAAAAAAAVVLGLGLCGGRPRRLSSREGGRGGSRRRLRRREDGSRLLRGCGDERKELKERGREEEGDKGEGGDLKREKLRR